MSFTDSARELLNRTEASLEALITDALKARAYREVAVLADTADALAAINSKRRGNWHADLPEESGIGAAATSATAELPRTASQPSWMKPRTTP